jgi:DNA-binding NarL/FixJ family response regulator
MAGTQELLLEKSIPPEYVRFQNDELLESTLCKSFEDNNLTRRESEILNLIVEGNTNKEISQKINRTERTIEYHRNRLMHKLGAKTAADLVKRAITMGIA